MYIVHTLRDTHHILTVLQKKEPKRLFFKLKYSAQRIYSLTTLETTVPSTVATFTK